jgi:DNA-binding MltR family transcriptional regulator
MSNLSEQIAEFVNNIRKLQARTHAEVGIVGAAIIEEKLEKALLTKMRPLSGEMKRRLFEGYGPLSSFSAKIDLSYALQVIDKRMRDDLTIIRKIRNQFAHSMSLVNFVSPEIIAYFKHFKITDIKESDYQMYYLRKLKEIETYLDYAIGIEATLPDTQSSLSQDAT